jgi:energy-coupling factor transport system ATP-binding protein
VTELAYELRKEGINVPQDILTVEELVKALWS